MNGERHVYILHAKTIIEKGLKKDRINKKDEAKCILFHFLGLNDNLNGKTDTIKDIISKGAKKNAKPMTIE